MPIYEYRCSRCGREFELLRPSSSADEPAPCEDCSAPSARMISAFARRRAAGAEPSGDNGGGRCGSCAGGSCATCR